MRRMIALLLLAGVMKTQALGQENAAANAAPDLAATPRSGLLGPTESDEYVKLKLDETRLDAQFKLLTELADLHRTRAETARKAGLETEKWEIALSRELQDRAMVVTRQLNETNKHRLAFEEKHTPPIIVMVGPGSLEPSGRLNPKEMAYVLMLDKRLAAVTDEWLAAMEDTKSYTLQLGTNRVPEDIDLITAQLNESSRRARELQREQTDLELRKLEFQALRP